MSLCSPPASQSSDDDDEVESIHDLVSDDEEDEIYHNQEAQPGYGEHMEKIQNELEQAEASTQPPEEDEEESSKPPQKYPGTDEYVLHQHSKWSDGEESESDTVASADIYNEFAANFIPPPTPPPVVRKLPILPVAKPVTHSKKRHLSSSSSSSNLTEQERVDSLIEQILKQIDTTDSQLILSF